MSSDGLMPIRLAVRPTGSRDLGRTNRGNGYGHLGACCGAAGTAALAEILLARGDLYHWLETG